MKRLHSLHCLFTAITAIVLFSISIGTATAANISGTVLFNGGPLSALVLANGQITFSNSADGRYALDVPLDSNGQITLQSFADGFAPFIQTFTPSGAPAAINMTRASADAPQITVQNTRNDYARPGWVRIGGSVASFNGTPLVALVLANGQSVFSGGSTPGKYDLEVPLDGSGQVTLQTFVNGFLPAKIVVTGNTTAPPTGEPPLTGTWEGGNRGTERPYYVCLNVSPDGKQLTTLNTACTGNQGQYRDAFNIQFQEGTLAGGGQCNQYAYIAENTPIRSDGTFNSEFRNSFVNVQTSGQFAGTSVSGTTRVQVFIPGIDCSIQWTAVPSGGNTTPPGGTTPPPPSGSGGTFEGGNRSTEDPYYVCLNVSPDGSSLTTAGTGCRGNQGNNQYSFDIQFQGGSRSDGSRCNGNANFSDNIQISGGSFTKSFNNGWVNILVNGTISGNNASGTAQVDSFGGICTVNWQATLP